ncbi:MAG: UDP-N-acetylmuramoyl-L-alanyl-D-glutamate--2,6-diaminopimelate ligase [Roseitalea sp.]|jgi:UDP-N-acetylmuramoyl-L-alanyl-D-glutamate--2,6-diaminopimelate ligase|nr:UDP-N-acetylmuramoyl-L-alanyl-D-glutamate--2,6-diaminopimelate ligase [Roseitalea sp.]MBO6722313.1 UDP-N-acetylmuramoyl-L-alanyl-D-glutamate--2,6-diaminopimelate ligase [Roseitalea sp.]MBO6742357.1 UDP-N-acetylmuramoyl-L-alanyl-D-glutamate--2,6-diaminopimelate ligase [Roseitalea sp.]
MRFSALSDLIGLAPDALPEGAFSGVTADSRVVAAGDLFVAVPGAKTDGASFAADAAARGAVAVLAGDDAAVAVDVPIIRAADPRRALALVAAKLHGPQPETMVAVTGTAGKTSVAAFTRQIFAAAGLKAAAIGTTGVIAPGVAVEGALTTPDPVKLHGILAELSAAGITHGAMEASSHGIDQRRLDGVHLAAAGFTNLGRDHLDYHPDIESYFASKMRLFDTLLGAGKPAVIFADDAWSARAIGAAKAAGCDVHTVGRKGDFIALKRVEHERHRQVLELVHAGATRRIVLPLAGDFQVANALVSAGLAIAAGVAPDIAFSALEHLEGAPGRLELVGTAKNGAVVYVDYAHKPEALEQVLLSVRPFTTGKVAVVFGCGGDRDPGKRPMMGEIAARLADLVYVTDDNPRSEDPATVRAAIMEAAPGATEIGDRREAIRTAVAALSTGDTLVVAGKGHETGQTAGGVTRPFSDHDEARAALSEVAA